MDLLMTTRGLLATLIFSSMVLVLACARPMPSLAPGPNPGDPANAEAPLPRVTATLDPEEKPLVDVAGQAGISGHQHGMHGQFHQMNMSSKSGMNHDTM